MSEVNVTCGCGRKMAQRGTDPAGTHRCGCGVVVRVQVAEHATCIGMTENGSRCHFLPVRESIQWDIALCRQHLQGYRDVLDLIKQGERASETIQQQMEFENAQIWEENHKPDRLKLEAAYAAQAVVYYVRIGDVIKIGTTVNMKSRMATLVPDEILATEPGGRDLEQMRHKQFRVLRVRGERFRPEDDLLSHIKMLREHHGEPAITGSVRMAKLPDPT